MSIALLTCETHSPLSGHVDSRTTDAIRSETGNLIGIYFATHGTTKMQCAMFLPFNNVRHFLTEIVVAGTHPPLVSTTVHR